MLNECLLSFSEILKTDLRYRSEVKDLVEILVYNEMQNRSKISSRNSEKDK